MRIPPASEFNSEGHWYSSYPSLNHWNSGVGPGKYHEHLSGFKGPLHLYLHIPFCKKLCYYCICNVIISSDREKIQYFLDHLLKEIDHLKSYAPLIRDIHFGGGTPSHLDQKQFSQLCDKLNEITDLGYLQEVAMEIDPRTVTKDDLRHYACHCVSRISFGIQDFNPEVQKAINREQPYEMVAELLEQRHLFRGINFDILYGLPLQTQKTLDDTLKKVIKLKPTRVTALKYCHAPEVRRHMKLIREEELPDPESLPKMFVSIVEQLTAAGYKWIGLDHFALPKDPLYHKCVRTFNGFSSGTQQMIGLGPTTTSVFGTLYAQAHYNLKEYYQSVNDGEFPILRGYEMSEDDMERRRIIFDLLCHQEAIVDVRFHRELNQLRQMHELCSVNGYHVKVSEYGRLLLRNICKVFDNKDVKPEHHKIAQLNMVRRPQYVMDIP